MKTITLSNTALEMITDWATYEIKSIKQGEVSYPDNEDALIVLTEILRTIKDATTH